MKSFKPSTTTKTEEDNENNSFEEANRLHQEGFEYLDMQSIEPNTTTTKEERIGDFIFKDVITPSFYELDVCTSECEEKIFYTMIDDKKLYLIEPQSVEDELFALPTNHPFVNIQNVTSKRSQTIQFLKKITQDY
ncbi:hypothetical protein M0811_09696 [Anaeramoeba ignava]|uniref:Uncharacterized protein n=1 Tax=Anaeramoeba ignava TaxID=1746090 RepID=A0A9Q0LFT3_ANAIG|nr:hypothetical protein M0811_09696 [Anaeramoeba ignava]